RRRRAAGGRRVSKRSLQREKRGQICTVRPLGEEMERVARVPAGGLGEPDEAVDEESPRADLCGLRQERAIGLLQLLVEELPRGEDQLQSPVPFQLAQVPSEERRVANELVRGHLEQDDHPRLVELAGT